LKAPEQLIARKNLSSREVSTTVQQNIMMQCAKNVFLGENKLSTDEKNERRSD
jgi:hypothetical protein